MSDLDFLDWEAPEDQISYPDLDVTVEQTDDRTVIRLKPDNNNKAGVVVCVINTMPTDPELPAGDAVMWFEIERGHFSPYQFDHGGVNELRQAFTLFCDLIEKEMNKEDRGD